MILQILSNTYTISCIAVVIIIGGWTIRLLWKLIISGDIEKDEDNDCQ